MAEKTKATGSQELDSRSKTRKYLPETPPQPYVDAMGYLLKQRQLPLLAVSKKEEGFPGGLPGDVGQLIGQQIVGGYLRRICDADQCLQAGPSLSGLYGADSGRGFSNGFGQLFLGKARLPPGGLNSFSQLFVVDFHKQNLQL